MSGSGAGGGAGGGGDNGGGVEEVPVSSIATNSFVLNKDQITGQNDVNFMHCMAFGNGSINFLEYFVLQNGSNNNVTLSIYDGEETELLLGTVTVGGSGIGFRRGQLDPPVPIESGRDYWLAIGIPNSGPALAGVQALSANHVTRKLTGTTTPPASVPVNSGTVAPFMAGYSIIVP